MYGVENLATKDDWLMDRDAPLGVRIITAAPEINGVLDAVHELDQRGVVFSIGHRYSISNCLRRISVCLLRVYHD
jgi:N-acetylglucosamine-6-phosphate deacetylase